MFSREYRPLKRPRLGVPDFYPQDDKQREDELNFHTLNTGYRLPLPVETQDEFGTALKDFNQALLNTKEYSHRVNQVVEEKRKRRWVQDSERRRFQVTKDNFVPVPLGRSRKEIATQWFQELASNKPLSALAKKVPVFNKKEEIFDNLCEKDVPVSRAAWYIKMAAAHPTTMTDVKLNKKKQSTDPSYDWTVSLTKYMQECVWRISNETTPTPRPEGLSGGRHTSTSGSQNQVLSEDGMAEQVRWQYMVYLSSWLYQENLLDCHEFLRWLVERVEHIKLADTKTLQLYLPLVLKHLLDIGSCVVLARPLVKNCCQRLSVLFELEQKLAKIQAHPLPTPSSASSVKPNPDAYMDLGSMEDDSVFDSSLVTIKQEPGVVIKTESPSNGGGGGNGTPKPSTSGGSKKRSSISSLSKDRKHTAGTPSTLGNGEVPIITMKVEEEEAQVPISQAGLAGVDAVQVSGQASHFHWCMHHQSLMLQLCSIIQTVSLCCPTAFVHTKVFVGRGVQGGKTTLSLLPMGLTELPMPRSLRLGLQKKLLHALASAEQEITMRNKAVDADWSAVTVADLQTNSEGSNVQQVLKILDILDTHSFVTSHPFNPLTTLYHRISAEQRGAEQPLTNDMLVMLLCQWAVTPCRSGKHRPLVAARILRQRQDQIMLRDASWKEERDKASMDETWEDLDQTNFSKMSDFPFPFQLVLIRFLDRRAPLPDDLNLPVKSGEAFYHLILLFFELIRLSVFSYTAYLSKLIARGEIKSTIIPYLPFAREEVEGLDDTTCRRPAPHETEPLNLSFPLPTLKRPHLDTHDGSGGGDQSGSLDRGSQSSLMDLASGPPSPGGSFGTGMGNFMDLLSGGDPTASSTSSSMFPPSGGEVGVSEMDESRALFHKRAQQLKLLASETSHLVPPIEFSPPHTIPDPPDVTSSPICHHQTKENFNFSLATIFTDEEHQTVDPTLNKHASRHLIFAAYFPISGWGFGKQERNERAVVLCGVGRIRRKVESIIKGISSDLEHYFRLLHGIQTPILLDSKLRKLMVRFQSLPTFEQHIIATSCEDILRSALTRKTPYPACSQLVFVCELLEECSAIHQLFTLLVDIVACDFPPVTGSKGEHRRVQAMPPCLPGELCLPMVWLLQKYLTCLLLSQHDTTVLFENLCRVLDGLQSTEMSSCQKAVFLFLHLLYTKCSYLQTTFRSRFGLLCMQLGDGTLVESYSPHSTDMVDWQKMLTTKPSECNIPKLCAMLKGTHHLKAFSSFAIDVFSTACQKNITCQTLCDLAHVCAEVSSVFGAKVNKELMGAFRALCIPSQAFKSWHSGYSSLTSRTNVPMDIGMHSILISFVSLLMANHCFHLHDILTYIIRPIIRLYTSTDAGPGSTPSLEFVNALILHLFVDDYRKGVDGAAVGKPDASHGVVLPTFVQHCLEAKCQQLSLGYILMLLKDMVRISVNRSGGAGNKSESVLIHPSSSGNDVILGKLRNTMELLASQQWVQNMCLQQFMGRLLESDMLGDKYLSPPQARYLLLLLCPYTNSSTPGDIAHLAKSDAASVLADILKNLDQWTLKNSLLHINLSISHTSVTSARSALLEELASQVIHVFEDSCGDEWLGQTIECCVDGGDGSFSPSVWLVTPLISKLQESVLGRVLKSAGNVLGQGQWWNPEKSQEKRRATRASSGVTTPKTGLQWQQPFLELVLACMHAQSTTHEELLVPLKIQLSNFLAAFDKEGMPGDEHGKAMLYAALKLRLSLVGSMLGSICESTCSTLDWLHLLMQFICSGAIDRQTDTSELFTNCLDMICTLLGSLSSEFHSSLAGGGEDGKKVHTSCIKKIKAELANSKSYCASEIRQLFPLSAKTYKITTVKPPSSINLTKGASSNERIKGLRVQDVKEISPWEILEGVKNSGPLMLSWFGAVRMKRKNLWLEEQRHLVRFHTHQDQANNFVSGPHTVKLPSEEQIPMPVDQTPNGDISKILRSADAIQGEANKQANASGATPTSNGGHAGGAAGQGESAPLHPSSEGSQISSRGGGGATRGGTMMIDGAMSSKGAGAREGVHGQMPQGVPYRLDGMSAPYRMPNRPVNIDVRPQQMRACLDHIKEQNMATGLHTMYAVPGGMPGSMVGGRGVAPMSNYRIQVLQQRHMDQQRKMQYMRMMQHHHQQQQLQQQQLISHQQQYGQYSRGPQMMHPAVAAQVQPMQANPPMPMQQVIQQRQQVAYVPGPQVAPGGHVGMMGGPPTEQPGMQQYTPQQAPPGLYM